MAGESPAAAPVQLVPHVTGDTPLMCGSGRSNRGIKVSERGRGTLSIVNRLPPRVARAHCMGPARAGRLWRAEGVPLKTYRKSSRAWDGMVRMGRMGRG